MRIIFVRVCLVTTCRPGVSVTPVQSMQHAVLQTSGQTGVCRGLGWRAWHYRQSTVQLSNHYQLVLCTQIAFLELQANTFFSTCLMKVPLNLMAGFKIWKSWTAKEPQKTKSCPHICPERSDPARVSDSRVSSVQSVMHRHRLQTQTPDVCRADMQSHLEAINDY